MTGGHINALVRLIHNIVDPGGLSGATDVQLLERFAEHREESAFAALVERHASMVLGVCARLLRDANDAEDAFQATFLVLVRKARSISRPHLLANWLYGVARRTALEAKTRAARRQAREREVGDMAAADTTLAAVWADLRPVLDEEVERLPERYRVPFILCYLEGRTNAEAARIIGCPKGTVLSRLAWARERLRARLTRRGLAPSAGLIAAVLSSRAARAAVPPALVPSTVKAGLAFAGAASSAGSVAVQVISLANGVLKNMFWTKVLYVAIVLMILSFVGGAGVVAWALPGNLGDEVKNGVVPKEAPKAEQPVDQKVEDKAGAQEVLVAKPLVREIPGHQDYTGRIEPVATIQLRSRVSGYLVKVNAKEGAQAKKGDVLFEIDPRLYEAELMRAEAILAQVEIRFKLADAAVERAQALRRNNGISQEAFEKIAGDQVEARAAVRVAQANVAIASLNLSFTKVSAPIDGTISRRPLDMGSLVKADDTVLATLVSRGPMVLDFDIDEQTALRLRRAAAAGTPKGKDWETLRVVMGLADETDFPHGGRIESADARVDPQTGTLRLRAAFPNPDGLLVPGLSCRVRLTVGEPYKVLLLPREAVISDDEHSVFVVSAKNVVEKRQIELAAQIWVDGLVSVKKGLKAGEWVIVEQPPPDGELRAGMTVTPRPVPIEEGKRIVRPTKQKRH